MYDIGLDTSRSLYKGTGLWLILLVIYAVFGNYYYMT